MYASIINSVVRKKFMFIHLQSRADLCNAMFHHTKPRFADFLSLESGSEESHTSPAASLSGEVQTYAIRLGDIFTSLRSFSYTLSSCYYPMNIAVDEIYSLERRVVVLLAETNPAIHPESNLDPDQYNRLLEHRLTTYQSMLAVQIYIYLLLRDHFVPVRIFSVLVSRLCNSLYSPDFESKLRGTWQEMDSGNRGNDMLFWVLMLGALAAEGREERSSFRESFGTLCNVLGIRTLTEVVDKAKKIAWIERKVDEKLLKLWNETQGHV